LASVVLESYGDVVMAILEHMAIYDGDFDGEDDDDDDDG